MNPALQARQTGSTLIEVLVALLLLSIGLLALSAMLSFTIQLPKLAAYRAAATRLASSHIESIRANPAGDYTMALSYDGSFLISALVDCAYPACTPETLAAMDQARTQQAARAELPAGGLMVHCETPKPSQPCPSGDVWVVWQEPTTFAPLAASNADLCPPEVSNAFPTQKPRCLRIRFAV